MVAAPATRVKRTAAPLRPAHGRSRLAHPQEVPGSLLEEPRQPAATCKSLVDAALENGGKDNVTVIVADYVADETDA